MKSAVEYVWKGHHEINYFVCGFENINNRSK